MALAALMSCCLPGIANCIMAVQWSLQSSSCRQAPVLHVYLHARHCSCFGSLTIPRPLMLAKPLLLRLSPYPGICMHMPAPSPYGLLLLNVRRPLPTQVASSVEQAAQDLQTHPAIIATRAVLAEATGSVDTALRIVTAALQQRGVEPGAKKVPRGADQDAAHWLLQRLAGLQLQVVTTCQACCTWIVWACLLLSVAITATVSEHITPNVAAHLHKAHQDIITSCTAVPVGLLHVHCCRSLQIAGWRP